jgi:hypothetical protein
VGTADSGNIVSVPSQISSNGAFEVGYVNVDAAAEAAAS